MNYRNQTVEIKPSSHLINILKATKQNHPNFVLFLGAGASVTSNVPSASKLIANWRDKFKEVFNGEKPDESTKEIESNPWYGKPEEYSILFETLFDRPSQRREYIESQLTDAKPSWGYIYLVNLIENRVFNTIFTTNFDDLLNEACYQFSSNTRPLVCAHDSSIRYVRLTSKRPKIIKIHGDFLFDNIKNTLSELETLEDNTKDKFRQYATEYGFIFLGYAGNDKSIMDSLQTLCRNENSFPHGIYWCIRNESEITPMVRDLARNHKLIFIKIEGFDQFCSELHEGLELQIQEELRDPYACLARKLNKLIDSAKIPQESTHELIQRDMSILANNIKRIFDDQKTNDSSHVSSGPIPKKTTSIPAYLLAQVAEREQKFDEALIYAKKAINGNEPLKAYELAFRAAAELNNANEIDELIESLKRDSSIAPSKTGIFHNYAIDLIRKKFYAQADTILELGCSIAAGDLSFNKDYYIINKSQIYLHKGEQLPDKLVKELNLILSNTDNPYTIFGASIVTKNEEKAVEQIEKMLSLGYHSIDSILSWPISLLLSDASRTAILDRVQKFYKLRVRDK